jgi:cell division protein FtsI (penicillin-binding protein 3)
MNSILSRIKKQFFSSQLRSATPRASLAVDHWRFRLLWMVMLGVFVAIIGRAFMLQVVGHEFLQDKADAMIMRTDTIKAYRGIISDRNGVPLAVSTPLTTLWMDPKEYWQALAEHEDTLQKLKETPNSRSLKRKLGKNVFDLEALALIIGMKPEELKAKAQERKHSRFLVLKRQLPPQVAQVVMARKFQSVYPKIEYQRFYPQAQPNAQLLGLTNSRDKGIEGLEMQLNDRLAGHDGKMQVMRDKRGNRIKDVELIEAARPGENISLSIDSRLQYIMYRELAAGGIANNARSATAVALDAKTGEVLAMSSWPSFNPNDSLHGLDNKDAMRNRAVVDMFEPGSTMKPLTISAALESGKYVPSSVIDTSPGSLVIGNHRIRDHGNNGVIDLKTIIVKSSNVGVAKIALSLPKDTLPLFYKRMGFGARSPLKFPGESSGLILPPNLWNIAEVATMSYGYAINATVIQLAQAYATLASGGIQHPVTLFKQDTPPTGVRVLDEQIARDVIGMMEGVTAQGGTAKQAAIAGYRVAGKTGTAHKLRPDGKGYSTSDYRALFVGMAPASNPQIVLAVVVENPVGQYYGGLVAAPIFAKIMQESLRLRNVPLDKSLEPEPKGKAS